MSDQQAPMVSHGRGGAANITHDSTEYVDGSIHREGMAGDQGDGPFSTGRGGQGNIGSPRTKATTMDPHDRDVVPEAAMRSSTPETFHTGRGGQGNVGHSPAVKPHATGADADVPEGGMQQGTENYHIGQRGGQGNAVHEDEGHHEGFGEKIKNKLFHKKDGE